MKDVKESDRCKCETQGQNAPPVIGLLIGALLIYWFFF